MHLKIKDWKKFTKFAIKDYIVWSDPQDTPADGDPFRHEVDGNVEDCDIQLLEKIVHRTKTKCFVKGYQQSCGGVRDTEWTISGAGVCDNEAETSEKKPDEVEKQSEPAKIEVCETLFLID